MKIIKFVHYFVELKRARARAAETAQQQVKFFWCAN